MQGLLNPSSSSVVSSSSLANSGKVQILSVLISLTSNIQSHQYSWILDSGSTDHMTPKIDLFVSYEPCLVDKWVQTVDGTLLKIAGIGSVRLAQIGLLTNVLHVPKLFVSLISVQKIAKLEEYRIIFERIDALFITRSMVGGLDLLKSIVGSITYNPRTSVRGRRMALEQLQ